MPSKHIGQRLWEEVERKTVQAVTQTNKPISTTDMLKMIVIKGLLELRPDEVELITKLSAHTIETAIETGDLPQDRDKLQN